MQIKYSWVLILSFSLFSAGCVFAPKYDESEEYGDDSYFDEYGEEADAGDKIKHDIGNPAVMDLWQLAEEARQTGDYETAVLQLERALRIAPTDAVMWSRLAEMQLSQGNSSQAENLAAKSNAMTVDNPLLNYRNWLIIARARQSKGDDIGAQEAEYTANSFRP